MSMRQALNRLALYCAAQRLTVTAHADGFAITPRGMLEHHAHAMTVEELADRIEATNSAPVATELVLAGDEAEEARSAGNTLRAMGYTWRGGERWAPPIGPRPRMLDLDAFSFSVVPGYEQLAQVLAAAFHQAARGKGKERHASDAAFQDQSTQQIMRLLDSTDGAIHQAIKKLVEAKRLPHERAEAEQLGAIIYVASAIIAERRKHADRSQAANDPSAAGVACA